jgi:hypothetical protein
MIARCTTLCQDVNHASRVCARRQGCAPGIKSAAGHLDAMQVSVPAAETPRCRGLRKPLRKSPVRSRRPSSKEGVHDTWGGHENERLRGGSLTSSWDPAPGSGIPFGSHQLGCEPAASRRAACSPAWEMKAADATHTTTSKPARAYRCTHPQDAPSGVVLARQILRGQSPRPAVRTRLGADHPPGRC